MKKILFLIITIMTISTVNAKAKETPFQIISATFGPYKSIFSPLLFSMDSINSIISTLFSSK